VISGIVHVLISGCGWKDAPLVYGPRKTLYNRFERRAAKGVWARLFHALATTGGPLAELLIDSSACQGAPVCLRGKGGSEARKLDARAASRTTKIHALADRDCRLTAFLLTGGQVLDCIAADTLLDEIDTADLVHGDKGYDTNAVRQKIEAKGAASKNCFSPSLYKSRDAIERMFNRLRDFRHIAARYNRLAINFRAAVCIATTVS
jgi:transposase